MCICLPIQQQQEQQQQAKLGATHSYMQIKKIWRHRDGGGRIGLESEFKFREQTIEERCIIKSINLITNEVPIVSSFSCSSPASLSCCDPDDLIVYQLAQSLWGIHKTCTSCIARRPSVMLCALLPGNSEHGFEARSGRGRRLD